MTITTLKKRAEFVRIAKTGKKWVTRSLVVQALESDCQENSIRFGFTATKKIGNAVTRNRVKRRLRVLARDILPQIKKTSGIDIVLIGRYTTATQEFSDLQNDLITALKKLGIK